MSTRCYCTAVLRPDGTCRFGCQPHLAKPRRRAAAKTKQVNKRLRAMQRYDLVSTKEARAGMLNLPLTARYGGVEHYARHLAKRS